MDGGAPYEKKTLIQVQSSETLKYIQLIVAGEQV